jgi:DNA-binding MarR family transcriptional regulator
MKTLSPTQAEPESIAYELAGRVFEVALTLGRDLAQIVDDLQITRPLAAALLQLDPGQGPLSRRALADRLICDPSNVTFLVDRLEERGLVQRVVDPDDRRIKALSLTPAGVETRTRLATAAVEGPTFARLSPEQRRQLTELLGQTLGGTPASG